MSVTQTKINTMAFVIRIKLLFSSNYYYYRLSQLRLFLPVFLTPVEKGFSEIYSSIKLVYMMPGHQTKVYIPESDCQVDLACQSFKIFNHRSIFHKVINGLYFHILQPI